MKSMVALRLPASTLARYDRPRVSLPAFDFCQVRALDVHHQRKLLLRELLAFTQFSDSVADGFSGVL